MGREGKKTLMKEEKLKLGHDFVTTMMITLTKIKRTKI